MAKLARVLQKVFGDTAPSTEVGQIGSDNAGSPTTTKDLDTIQALTQYIQGLFAITNNATEPPRAEDFNALHFLTTTQLKYIFQSGIPEWITTENYYANVSIVQVAGDVYLSLTGTDPTPNTGNNPTSSPTDWRKVLSSNGSLDPSLNLSDLASSSTGRTNLDVYGKSETYTKTEVDAAIAAAIAPVGSVIAWTLNTPPTGYLECNGAAISRTTYADLFAILGVTYGVGDGTTTFNIPDYRGRFLRGRTSGSGRDPDSPSRTDRGDGSTGDNTGTIQEDAFQSHGHFAQYAFPANSTLTNIVGGTGAYYGATSIGGVQGPNLYGGGTPRIGFETRPKNVYILYCIKH